MIFKNIIDWLKGLFSLTPERYPDHQPRTNDDICRKIDSELKATFKSALNSYEVFFEINGIRTGKTTVWADTLQGGLEAASAALCRYPENNPQILAMLDVSHRSEIKETK